MNESVTLVSCLKQGRKKERCCLKHGEGLQAADPGFFSGRGALLRDGTTYNC